MSDLKVALYFHDTVWYKAFMYVENLNTVAANYIPICTGCKKGIKLPSFIANILDDEKHEKKERWCVGSLCPKCFKVWGVSEQKERFYER